jgi:NADPH:quinone reductase
VKAYAAQHGRLIQIDAPQPVPGPGQVLVEVRAAGLNAADSGMMAGTHVSGASVAPPTRDLAVAIPMGSEAAGTVVAVGEGNSRFKPGDRVMSICQGAFSPFVVMQDILAMPVPDGMSWAEAAAVPVTFTTAHDALLTAGRLRPGDNVLVTAASSGVGVAALQLARMFGAGIVAGSSRYASKLEMLTASKIPLDIGLVAGDPTFSEQALNATDGHGFDVIVDSVGAGALADNLATAALLCRIVSVGRSGGQRDEIDLDELARKRVSLIGVTFRTRSLTEIVDAYARASADCLPALADGRIRPVVDRAFPFDELAAAQAWMREGRSIGKVVIERS